MLRVKSLLSYAKLLIRAARPNPRFNWSERPSGADGIAGGRDVAVAERRWSRRHREHGSRGRYAGSAVERPRDWVMMPQPAQTFCLGRLSGAQRGDGKRLAGFALTRVPRKRRLHSFIGWDHPHNPVPIIF
jgi:hypothetical protein